MTSQRDIRVLKKLVDESVQLTNLIKETEVDEFLQDERTKRAVCMTLINIGELIKNLTDDLRQHNPQIPWKLIAGLRDVTAHKYQTLRMEDIWVTATEDIPKFHSDLLEILDKISTA